VQLPVAVAALGRVVPRRRQLGHQRVQVFEVVLEQIGDLTQVT
jgi:hypothetical protein